MKNFLGILFIVFIASCSKSPEEQLDLINGYWEIASVETAEGMRKEYSISQNIDFIQIEDGKGIRKKVQPNLTGDFKTTNAQENIDIELDHDTITFLYTTAYDAWQEQIVKVTSDQLIIENENGDIYTYRRYTPLSIE